MNPTNSTPAAPLASRLMTGVVALLAMVATLPAMEMNLSLTAVEDAMRTARGTDPARAAFHRGYLWPSTEASTVERFEVITEFRRLVLMGEKRVAFGDHLFTRGTLAAQQAIQPWHGMSVVAHLRFHPQNAFVMAPAVEVMMDGPSGRIRPLDVRTETQFALPSGVPGQSLPVVGATVDAMFDSVAVGQTLRTVVVRLDGRELGRATIDFGRMR